MTNVQSKLLQPVFCTCKDFQHPWTNKCANASAGLILSSAPYCLRVYTVVYVISLLMRGRIPKMEDIKKMLVGILQSTAFLVTNSYTFILYNCLIRNLIGRYYLSTVAFVPCFLSALTAILIERPARRPLLALYVANVATETLWNMGEARGYVRSMPQGQTVIFGLSISILLYLYRLGLHKTICKDSIFNILRIFVSKHEEGPIQLVRPAVDTDEMDRTRSVSSSSSSTRRSPLSFRNISSFVQLYGRIIDRLKSKHESCQHSEACLKYVIMGGLKPFVGGVTFQVVLKLLMNVKKIAQGRMDWNKSILNKSSLNLGLFLGSFSFLYKSVSCLLRHSFDRDDALFAIPAGLIGSIAFTQYSDVTVALYVMWKMLQIIYNYGIEKGVLPNVPGFIIMLYSFSTAVLFHAGILEATSLRPSYFKFLQSISGERLSKFNLVPFDIIGRNPSGSKLEVMKRLNIIDKSVLPKFALAS